MHTPDEKNVPILEGLVKGPTGVQKVTDIFEGANKRLSEPNAVPELILLSALPGSGKTTLLRTLGMMDNTITFEDALKTLRSQRPDFLEIEEYKKFYRLGSTLHERNVRRYLKNAQQEPGLKIVTAPVVTGMVDDQGDLRGSLDAGSRLAWRLAKRKHSFGRLNYNLSVVALFPDEEVTGTAMISRNAAAEKGLEAKNFFDEISLPAYELEEALNHGNATPELIERFWGWFHLFFLDLIVTKRMEQPFFPVDGYSIVETFFPFYFGKYLEIPEERFFGGLNRFKLARATSP